MSQYPIILIPAAIAKAKAELPPLSLPPAPQSPENPQQPVALGNPPQRMNWGLLGILTGVSFLVTLFLIGVAGWAAWTSLFVLAAVSGEVGAWSIQSYPQRQQDYEKRKRQHTSETIRYQRALAAMPERKQQYQAELGDYTRTVERLKVEQANSKEVAAFRRDRLRQVLTYTQSYDGTNSTARQGSSEATFNKYLCRYFGDSIYTRLTLAIPNFEYPYSPDFAYIDQSLNLHIDIEIDEPYSHSGKPTHYIDKDDLRNNFFLKKSWIVVRFCEQQVKSHPDRCCKVLAQVISEMSGDHALLKLFVGIKNLEPVPQWTHDESLQMCRARTRDDSPKVRLLHSQNPPQISAVKPMSSTPASQLSQTSQAPKPRSRAINRAINRRRRKEARRLLNNQSEIEGKS